MTVLIIEDDNGVAEVLKRFLSPVASQVIVAQNMQTAIDALSSAVEIDIITLDLGLPDSGVQDTLEAIKAIKKTKPLSLVVVITGQEIPGLEKVAIEKGADGVILKQGEQFTARGILSLLQGLLTNYISKPQHYANSASVLEKLQNALQALNVVNNENPTVTVRSASV